MTDTIDPISRIGRTHVESAAWFERRPRPPEGAPNVIYVVLDDVGYSDLGCFGSTIETPSFDSLADRGLRYANFHTTTLCSPTRASLLTGRNHHSVGMRYLANLDMGWPSGRGAISHRAATIAEMLKDTGYSTFAIGKWHLAPTEDASAAGPFDQWPLGRGFERFYGFMNGGTDQYHPELVEDNHLIEPPKTPAEGYHLSEDLIDRAIGTLRNQISLTPNKPFFMHLCFGAGHFPHQAPPDMIAKYKGHFSAGWDAERDRRLKKQKAMGLVPSNTDLPERNPGVAAWDQLSADEKTVFERMQEVYAGFLDYTDQQFGRLLAFLDETGRRDNTLIVLISDNGASTDCGHDGTENVLKWFNQIPDSAEVSLSVLERLGTEESFGNYPWGWAQASNTPLKLYKSFAHGGGVRDPMIVSWPKRMLKGGGVRQQFHHVVDITPTVLEVCGVTAPETYRGIAQLPIHGTSFAYTFEDADQPTRKVTQYFEMYGHRSIWHKGWKAVTKHVSGSSFETEKWELYHLDNDFSEVHDLAESAPEKLQEMKERWWAEAGKYDVMPLDDRITLFKPDPKPGSIRGHQSYEYFPPLDAIPGEAAPLTQDVSHRIDVTLSRSGRGNGPLVAFGNMQGGYALFIADNRLIYAYNHVGDLTHIVSDCEVPDGDTELSFVFSRTGPMMGRGEVLIEGKSVGLGALDKTLIRLSLSPLRIGGTNMPPVSPRMAGHPQFEGVIHRVGFALGLDRGRTPETLDVD
ncbi:arylsulfatase [Devosia rhodophyticola]|uniref:Arylsulfatase n=1 Tax=Devosia rhodophyticola TaxID=3026423 RepID=A0ABY7Z1D3_9HYPH|nr:arylsulfatase [Devosia rhodophyticola]WDR07292.1 arylsulfatase [Devosia rhodophyticola]